MVLSGSLPLEFKVLNHTGQKYFLDHILCSYIVYRFSDYIRELEVNVAIAPYKFSYRAQAVY